MDIREAYLGAATAAADLIGRREVGDRWGEPSALAEMTVRALAGHLARAVLQVEWVLDRPEPEGERISAVQYYAELEGLADVHSDLNEGVRARGEETAGGGWARLYLDVGKALDRIRSDLPGLPSERAVEAFSRALTIDEYLKTRLVEIAVHVDDLALSAGVDPPELPIDASACAIAVLVGVARTRHGDVAVLRALARRERDDAGALRVF